MSETAGGRGSLRDMRKEAACRCRVLAARVGESDDSPSEAGTLANLTERGKLMARKAGVSRRDFLKGAAAAVAAPYVLTSTALGAAGRPTASERIRMAAIGVGAQGGGHLGGLARHSGVEVVAV